MKLKIMASCALLALAGCASSNATVDNQPQVSAQADYQLPAVYFDFNSVALSDNAKSIISESIQQVDKNQDLELVITGYADMYGNDAVNKKVSKQRAQSVKDYLSSLNIPADKMQVEAKGKSELRTTDPDAQDGERRVEVKVVNGAAAATAAAVAAAEQEQKEAAKKAQQEKQNQQKNQKKNKKDCASDEPWYKVLFDCMCED